MPLALACFFLRDRREPDDTLRVFRLPQGRFRIVYVDGEAGSTDTCECTGRELWTYLFNIFYSVSIDV